MFQNKSKNTFPDLDKVKRLKGEVEGKLWLSGKLQQKIKICQKDEAPYRLYIFSRVLVVIALAAESSENLVDKNKEEGDVNPLADC